MRTSSKTEPPLAALLHAYVANGVATVAELHRLPVLGERNAAVLAATAKFLFTDFLDTASEDRLGEALERFYLAVVAFPAHVAVIRKRVGFLRHALSHLLLGRETPARKLEACLASSGAYRLPGLGPSFWSALLQGVAPSRHPAWSPLTFAGLRKLGAARIPIGGGPDAVYAALQETHARVRGIRPELNTLHIDHFLALISLMPGRNPLEGAAALGACPVALLVRQLRKEYPLRQRLKKRGEEIALGQRTLEEGLRLQNGKLLGDALALADPVSAARSRLDWHRHAETLALWIGRLWEAEDPYARLAEFWRAGALPAGGLWLPAAVLHLRDPQLYLPFGDPHRAGLSRLDDALAYPGSTEEYYRVFNTASIWLRERHTLHPLELPDLLLALAGELAQPSATLREAAGFQGFCADTFVFLGELARENTRDWMEQQRSRYQFTVREPLLELCTALAERYIRPVLGGVHSWQFDTEARSGKALTSIRKNVFRKELPYNSSMWITFCPQGAGRNGPQLFVHLAPSGLRYGLRLGRGANAPRERLRAAIATCGADLARKLSDTGTLQTCRFGLADQPDSGRAVSDERGLAAWAAERSQEVWWRHTPQDAVLGEEALVGEIALGYDRLLPLFACCWLEDPASVLVRVGVQQGTSEPVRLSYQPRDFHTETYLSGDWLRQALDLLSLKKQLILQGVPGTGKTHVARCLGRLLARGDASAVRLVQFHPAYSYEEFVEGIKVRSVPPTTEGGRHEVTYPVEDGLLCAFAARAAERPAQPHVLIIDEINRGNLPRIFGELLYLLEYRGQTIDLPYSRRSFSLPGNLFLLATMNGADRSIAALDQALRRRFSFLEMDPDAAVLAAWLNANPPAGGQALATRVLTLFERLNTRLQGEMGVTLRIGHSYFMVPNLDENRLRMIWKHQVRPLLDEALAGQPGRAAAYDQLLEPTRRQTAPS